MEKSKNRKVAQIIVAVLITLALWIYMEVYVSPESTVEVKDIPVEFTNEDTILAENGLMLLSGYDTTVDLKLKGARKDLMWLDTSQIRIVANTGGVTSAGVQSLKYDIVFPSDFPSNKVTVDSRSLYNITVTVGQLYSREVPIEVEVKGQVADGYFTDDISIDPQKLTLRAEREDMLNVKCAKVTINLGGATSTLIETLEYTLYDYDDVPVENDNIRSNIKLIQVTVPVRTTKTVPLSVNLVGTELMESVNVDIFPTSVTLVGDGSTLSTINEVVLDKIYVEDLVPGMNGPFTYTIKLPAGVTTTDGTTEAVVSVAINGTTEGTVTLNNITCEGVAEGLKATVVDPLEVTVWGDEDEINAVTADQLRARVDLSEITETGDYQLPVTVTASEDSGVTVRGTYQVNVRVTHREAQSENTTPASNTTPGAAGTSGTTGTTSNASGGAGTTQTA